MQLDLKYDLFKFTIKCKNRDIVISNKLLPNNGRLSCYKMSNIQMDYSRLNNVIFNPIIKFTSADSDDADSDDADSNDLDEIAMHNNFRDDYLFEINEDGLRELIKHVGSMDFDEIDETGECKTVEAVFDKFSEMSMDYSAKYIAEYKIYNSAIYFDPHLNGKQCCVINYYADNNRYFSFGFIPILSAMQKIPAYYTYNVFEMPAVFFNNVVIYRVIMYWDVANVTGMQSLFYKAANKFNIAIVSNWNVVNVKNMDSIFYCNNIYGNIKDISNWNISNANRLKDMFSTSKITGDIADICNWNVANVTDMSSMFSCTQISGDIGGIGSWDVSNVVDMESMFYKSKISGDIKGISNWDVSNVVDMENMFFMSNVTGNIESLNTWNCKKIKRIGQAFDKTNVII